MIFHPDHEKALHGQGLDSFDSIYHAEGFCLDKNRDRDVLRLSMLLDESPLYLKRFHSRKKKVARKWADHEHRKIKRFMDHGFPGPDCITEGWSEAARSEAFLLFRAPADTRTLDEYFRAESIHERRRLSRDLAEVLGRMHAGGIFMPDLLARHVIVSPDRTFYFIDLAHLVFGRRAHRRAARDLARLSSTIESVIASRSDRLRFLNHYARKNSIVKRDTNTFRSFLKKVAAEEKSARHRRRFPELCELEPLPSDRGRCYVNRAFSEDFKTLELRTAADFESPGHGARLLRDIGVRSNYRLETERNSFFLKVHRHSKSGKGDLPGRREWNNHMRLIRMGINCPVPAAWGEGPGFSFFASQACEGRTADIVANDWATLTKDRRRTLIRNMALVVARLHACAFYHRDLYLCHLIEDETRIRLIDLQRLEDDPPFRRHRQVKDLAALLYSSYDTDITCTDRLRFLRFYCGGGSLSRKGRELARAVMRKARKIADRQERKENRGGES